MQSLSINFARDYLAGLISPACVKSPSGGGVRWYSTPHRSVARDRLIRYCPRRSRERATITRQILTEPAQLVVVLEFVLETVHLALQLAQGKGGRGAGGLLIFSQLPLQSRHTPLQGPKHFRLDHPRGGGVRADDLEEEKKREVCARLSRIRPNAHRIFSTSLKKFCRTCLRSAFACTIDILQPPLPPRSYRLLCLFCWTSLAQENRRETRIA